MHSSMNIHFTCVAHPAIFINMIDASGANHNGSRIWNKRKEGVMALTLTRKAQPVALPRLLFRSLRHRLDVWRTRRALARLDAHLLSDIGLTREDALREAQMTVWDVPATWVSR
jgi:uncharacterized protein YjiS (DUF1127 family)